MEKLLKLKKFLIQKIEKSDDVDFLSSLNEFLEIQEKGIYELSLEQQNAVNEGMEQIASGELTDNDVLFKELQEWLQKK